MSAFTMIVSAILVITCLKLFQLYNRRQWNLKKVENIPGPPAFPILGNGLDFTDGTSMVLPKLTRFAQEYGYTFKCLLGPNINIFTLDPKLIEFICSSKTEITKSSGYRFFHNWLGTGLLTATNPKWKIHRKILLPTFHVKLLENCMPILKSNSDNLIEYLKNSVGKVIDIHEDVVYCSLDIICEAVMGFTRNALKERNSSDYAKSVKHMTKCLITRNFSVWRQLDFFYKFSSDYNQETKCLQYLHSLTGKVIKTRRKHMLERKQTETEEASGKMAFLDLLLRSSTDEGGSLSDEDIRQEVDTFMFAGHDTVSTAISFTLYLLSKNMEVQDQLYEEIYHTLGGDGFMTMEKLNKMKYLEMVIKEGLRLYPPVPMFAREITDDITFDGKVYPKGVTVTIVPYILHRHKDFYEDPEEFKPERFNFENNANRDSYVYIPFSSGPRNCIGQKFAMLEMKSIICSFLLHFRVEPSDIPLKLAAETVLTSLNGVHVRLEKR